MFWISKLFQISDNKSNIPNLLYLPNVSNIQNVWKVLNCLISRIFQTSPKLHRSYYPHRSRDSLSPVCGIFVLLFAQLPESGQAHKQGWGEERAIRIRWNEFGKQTLMFVNFLFCPEIYINYLIISFFSSQDLLFKYFYA